MLVKLPVQPCQHRRKTHRRKPFFKGLHNQCVQDPQFADQSTITFPNRAETGRYKTLMLVYSDRQNLQQRIGTKMTIKGLFSPKLFYDSMLLCLKSIAGILKQILLWPAPEHTQQHSHVLCRCIHCCLIHALHNAAYLPCTL